MANSNRYKHRLKIVNRASEYQELLDDRGVKFIEQYSTPVLSRITPKQRASLPKIKHIWKLGDKFYKLAYKHYNDPKLWWIIAWYNTTPTESHVKIGDTIRIPYPLEKVYKMMRIF